MTMNRNEDEGEEVATEFAVSTEEEFVAEFTMEEVDSRKAKIESEEKISGGGRRQRRNDPSILKASVTIKAEVKKQ